MTAAANYLTESAITPCIPPGCRAGHDHPDRSPPGARDQLINGTLRFIAALNHAGVRNTAELPTAVCTAGGTSSASCTVSGQT